MEGKQWLYFLINAAGGFYAVENGLVVVKTEPTPLRNTPDGWQDISLGWERNMTEFGINRKFSLPLGFVLDGAQILRYIIATKGYEEPVFLVIKRQALHLDPAEYYYYHKYFYKGELDLSSFKDEETRVECSIMEGQLTKDYKANKNTMYELDIDSLEPIYVKMDGVRLRTGATMPLIDDLEISSMQIALGYLLPVVFINQEGLAPGISIKSQNLEQTQSLEYPNAFDFLAHSENWFCKNENSYPVPIRLNGTLPFETVKNDVAGAFSFRFQTNLQTPANQGLYEFYPATPAGSPGDQVDIPFDLTITLQPNERLFFRGALIRSAPAQELSLKFREGGFLRVGADSIYKTTYIKALWPGKVYSELVKNISGSAGNASSQLLEDRKNIVISSGDAIRSLAGAKVKTRLADFFTSYNVVMNAGLGIEGNKIVFERKSHFFDKSNPIPLGKVKNVNIKLAIDLLFNNLKIGYPDQEYNDVNGREEFNITDEWSTAIKKIVKVLELVSIYRADPFGIEYTRINLDGKDSTDSGADNDVFLLNINSYEPKTLAEAVGDIPAGTTYYELRREVYDLVEGLTFPETLFNIEELTPRRLIAEHGNWIKSLLFWYENTYLTFQTNAKNAALKTVFTPPIAASQTFDEDIPIPVSSLNEAFAIPIYVEFEPEASIDIVELLEENPNRCFSFEHPNGQTYTGYNMKIGIAANSLQSEVFQLLLTNDNDIQTLING